MYNNIKKLINTDNLKKIYDKFIKLPIYYKVLVSITLSLILHFSFTTLLYVGIYNYTLLYKIPFSSIENFDLNLFLVPFYFDMSRDIFALFLFLFFSYIFTILYKVYWNKGNSFRLKKRLINIYIRFSNPPVIKHLNKNDRKNVIYTMFILTIFLLIGIFVKSFNLGGIYYKIITILLSIFLGYYFAFTNTKLTFKLLFPLFILFIVLPSFSIISSHKISQYLISTRLGGELPLSLKIEDKYFDGFLLLRTKEQIYMYDVNKTFISEFKADSIDKVTYKYSINNDESTDKNMTDLSMTDLSMSATMSDTEINFTSYHK